MGGRLFDNSDLLLRHPQTRSCLAALKFERYDSLTNRTLLKIEHLRHELWEYGTLKPMSYFKIKNSIFLQISGIIFMYLVVMMQFRISE